MFYKSTIIGEIISSIFGYFKISNTMEKVETEFMLTFLGYNIRKLFRFFGGKARFDYWKAPEDLKPEEKKKPSAKRLSNKVNRKKNRSVNEEAKSKYKYK